MDADEDLVKRIKERGKSVLEVHWRLPYITTDADPSTPLSQLITDTFSGLEVKIWNEIYEWGKGLKGFQSALDVGYLCTFFLCEKISVSPCPRHLWAWLSIYKFQKVQTLGNPRTLGIFPPNFSAKSSKSTTWSPSRFAFYPEGVGYPQKQLPWLVVVTLQRIHHLVSVFVLQMRRWDAWDACCRCS